MSARRAGTLAVTVAALTALLAVLLVTWAASIGPSDVLQGEGPAPATPTAEPTSATPQPSEDATPTTDSGDAGGIDALWVVALLLNAATAVLAVYLLYRLVRWLRRIGWERRQLARERAAGPPEFEVLAPEVAVAQEMLADAGAQRDLLGDGTPRNAVVACWHRFEAQAAAAGLERRPWETSSEYTMRVLDLVDAYAPAVSRLGTLYREARFSEHELTEADRRDAVDALDTIHRTIGVGA